MDENGKGLGGQDEGGEPETKEQMCLICGCTDKKACEGGCSWVKKGLCSKCVFVAVPECVELLIETILETHLDEINAGHHGDETCSTCDLIKVARKIVVALQE